MSLTLDHVSKRVGGVPHIEDACLHLESGSLNVLLGETLSGKTTMMRLMAGLEAPTHGRVLANGRDVTGVHVRQRSVAMVYQQFINYPTFTVYENIASPLRVKGASGDEIDRRVRQAASLLRLEPYLSRTPLALSGGQQQRTAIARAVVKEADLVLLDEPLANLDYKLREELREELPRIFAATGAVFVYATTEPAEALLLGGNTVCLHQGRVIQSGRTPAVYRLPNTLNSARTFSDPPLNVMRVVKRGDHLLLPDGRQVGARGLAAGAPQGPLDLAIRAHDLFLAASESDSLVPLEGVVEVTEIAGSESFIHVHAGQLRWVVLAPGIQKYEAGSQIRVAIDLDRVFLFLGDGDGALVAAPQMRGAC